MCERNSRVSGSTIANSSSIPRVKCVVLCAHGRGAIPLKNGSLSSWIEQSACPPVGRTGPLARSILKSAAKPHLFGIVRGAVDPTSPSRYFLRELAQRSPCHRGLHDICPSSNCRGQVRVRALYGSPFRKPLRPPIRNLPDRRWPLPHPGAGLQKSIATGTPSRIANSTVFKS